MATQFRLAALGHTMEKGRVVEWHVSEGSNVAEGQLLVSIETDKKVGEVESTVAGEVLRSVAVSYKNLRAHETLCHIVWRLLLVRKERRSKPPHKVI